MADDHDLFPPDAPTRSIGPTMSADATGYDPNAPPLLRNGQEFGAYTVVRMLGRGGMGEVYEAEDRENARRVALKVLSRGLATPADRARFIREGRLAAGISHPNTVYVYGTDDIEGVPVIAMELAPGGTLKDLVKARGQLTPTQAVDAILQVITGLDAAAEAGVLHRDVKPSNCFLDSDGSVKVGDFGLSISTQTFDERSLTMLGTVLGTPGFSSPEQLRGDELDVRSDIYSVGATLYYLITGRAPFEDGNVIKLVTRVAQEMPPSPRTVRPDVPDELSGAIMRALAKRPEARFASYDELRLALSPFSSSAPLPGALGQRFVAGIVDNIIMTAASTPVLARYWDAYALGERSGMIKGTLASWIIVLLYYGVVEGWWGRSIGKQLFSLRVVDASNQRPGILRGVLRAAAWVLVTSVPVTVYAYMVAPVIEHNRNTPLGGLVGFSLSVATFVVIALAFSTARRTNGFAALHDRLSGTRVIRTRDSSERRRASASVTAALPVSRRERLGPYVILDERPLGIDDVVSGYDDRLRRKVWLHVSALGSPPVATDRRVVARPTRVRWLAGRRTGTEAWDAYEAVEGTPLTSSPGPHAWADVRHWLLDLATEIRALEAGASHAVLTPGRVWIAPNGHARLLDWDSAAENDGSMLPQAFLHTVALRALGRDGGIHGPLPLNARAVLDKLGSGAFESTDAIVSELKTLNDEPAGVRRGRRIAHLLTTVMPMVFAGGIMAVSSLFIAWAHSQSGAKNDLTEILMRIDVLERAPNRKTAPNEQQLLEAHVAANYAEVIRDQRTWTEGWSMIRFNAELRTIANRILATHPTPTAEQRAAAAAFAEPFLVKERAKAQRATSLKGLVSMVGIFVAFITMGSAVLGLLSALLFRGGLMLRLFGIAISTATGQASRLRAFWRAVIAWSPALVFGLAIWMSDSPLETYDWLLVELVGALLFFGGFVYAARNPERGLQDRLAGTWLVPR